MVRSAVGRVAEWRMQSFGNGYRAVVFGASGGIGSAVLAALAADPRCGQAIGLSRSRDGLDLADEASVAAAAAALRNTIGDVDMFFDATGALTIEGVGPEKTIRAIDPVVMARQFAVNAIGPALLIKHFAPLMPIDRRAAFATLSARVGSIADNRLGGWISYRASKAALNQIVRTASVEIARTHRLAAIAALHPGTVETGLTKGFGGSHDKQRPDDAATALLGVIDSLAPAQTGSFLAYDGSTVPW